MPACCSGGFGEVHKALKWERGTNPYVHNLFGRLQIGPTVRPTAIIQRARGLAQRLSAGEEIVLREVHLDEHAISEASRKLNESGPMAQELLLVHQPVQGDNGKLKALAVSVSEAAALAPECPPISLLHPAAIFWFTPTPGPECAPLPNWAEFSFPGPNDESDLELDI